MSKRIAMLGVIALAAIVVWPVVGQDAPRGERPRDRQGRGAAQGERGQRGQRPRGFLPPEATPIVKALDADKNGKISFEEIDKGVAALKKLDKNNDKALTREEYTARPRGFTDRLKDMDKNKDGKITKDELPEGFGDRMLERFDADKDGTISAKELETMAKRMRGFGQRGGTRGQGRQGQGRGGQDRPREGGREQ